MSSMFTTEFLAQIGGMFIALFIGSLAFFGVTSFFAIGEGCFIALAGTYNLFVVMRSLTTKVSLNALVVIPLLIGALAFTRLTRYRWLARYPIAIMSGVGAGIVFGNQVKSMIIAQITTNVNKVLTGTPDPISAWATFIPMICVPLAFTYSVRYSGFLHRGPLRHLFTLGRTFFLLYVGAYMGELAGSSLLGYIGNFTVSYIKRPIVALQDYLAGTLTLT